MSRTITRRELVDKIAKQVGTDNETVVDALAAIERTMIDSLGQNKLVAFKAFGTFRKRHRTIVHSGLKGERNGIPQRETIIHFRPSDNMVKVHE